MFCSSGTFCIRQVHYEYNVPGTSVEQCAFDIAVNASEMTMSSLFKPPPVGAQIAFCVRSAL